MFVEIAKRLELVVAFDVILCCIGGGLKILLAVSSILESKWT